MPWRPPCQAPTLLPSILLPGQDIIVGSKCSDDWFDAGATCGFAKDVNKQDIM